jgi:hypothetical protein
MSVEKRRDGLESLRRGEASGFARSITRPCTLADMGRGSSRMCEHSQDADLLS